MVKWSYQFTFTRCYVSVEQNSFLTSFDFYLKCLTWWNFNFESFRACLPNISKFVMFLFFYENGQFPKGLTYYNEPFWYENLKSANILQACCRLLKSKDSL